jgi:hypothetical protein
MKWVDGSGYPHPNGQILTTLRGSDGQNPLGQFIRQFYFSFHQVVKIFLPKTKNHSLQLISLVYYESQ